MVQIWYEPAALLAYAILVPSGDHESAPSLTVPPVSCVNCVRPVPSMRTVNTFDECPFWPNAGCEKTMRVPSGEQSILSACPPHGVMRRTPCPSRRATKMAVVSSSPGFPRRKATRFLGSEHVLSPPGPGMFAGRAEVPPADVILSRPTPVV